MRGASWLRSMLPIARLRKPGSTRRLRAMPHSPRPVNSPKIPCRVSPNRRNRNCMLRIVLFLLLIALAAVGAAWVADQPGDVMLTWGGTKLTTTLPVFVLGVAIIVVAAMIVLGVAGALWRTPGRVRRRRHERRTARGRHAITHGLLAIGHGDQAAARQ